MKTINRLISSVMIATAGVAVSSAAVITGSLRDPETGEGEPYATVRIYRGTSAEGSPLVTSTTDIDGNFSETLTRAGDYTVVFNSFGKKTESRLVTVGSDGDISLGDIEMLPAPTMLNEVTVTAQRPLVKMTADKVAYNVAEDADSKTNTLLDMLRKMPMVAVDGEDNITVNGSGNFKVYVDGRPSLMFSSNPSQIFKSMPATSVQSVEVIVNPGAQFDAEGAGGVINLVMNKTGNGGQATSTDGIMGTASVRGGLNGGDASVFVSGSKDKVSFSANVMHSDMRPGETKTSNDRTQGDETITTASAGKPGMHFTMGNLSVSYTPDSLTTVGLTGGLNRFGLESSGSSHTSITGLKGPVTDYTSMIDMTSRRLGVNGSLSLGRRFTDRFNSNLSLIYQISHERNKADTESDFSAPSTASLNLADRSSLNRENTTEHILQADYTMAPRAGHTFETGAKMSWRSVGTNSTFLSADAPRHAVIYPLQQPEPHRRPLCELRPEGRQGRHPRRRALRAYLAENQICRRPGRRFLKELRFCGAVGQLLTAGIRQRQPGTHLQHAHIAPRHHIPQPLCRPLRPHRHHIRQRPTRRGEVTQRGHQLCAHHLKAHAHRTSNRQLHRQRHRAVQLL